MQRISGPGATVDHKFTDGDPSSSTPATDVVSAWLNSLQEEGCHIVEASGATLDPADNTQILTALMNLMHPVGTLYWTADLTVTPATLFGVGTWAKVAVGRAPVGYDVSQTEFNAVGKQGGEKAHVLTMAELPAAGVGFTVQGRSTDGAGTGALTGGTDSGGVDGSFTGTTDNLGSGQGHNNLQPYEVIGNIWKRTA
jgi:hypothetical protein